MTLFLKHHVAVFFFHFNVFAFTANTIFSVMARGSNDAHEQQCNK